MIRMPLKIRPAPVSSRHVTVSMPKMTPKTALKTLSRQSSTAACVDVVCRCAHDWITKAKTVPLNAVHAMASPGAPRQVEA